MESQAIITFTDDPNLQMKADQDALERRLWAKQEKVKADHSRREQADRDM